MKDKLKGIYEILKKDTRLVNEDGELLKNRIQELTLKTDECLLKTLLDDELTKNIFFTNIDGIFVFDKTKFMWMIDSKDFLPDSYTAFLNKIILIDKDNNSIGKSDNVVLSFPCKDCVVEMDSTEEKDERNEMFFNEVLMKSELDTLLSPKVLVNAKKYSKGKCEEVTEIGDDDNLIIKGNNLLTLHSLLPIYKEKIKLMYWDILYNTDSDKVPYNDSFKHSSWLTMMKNRLDIAKKLLKDDGCICIQINDDEKDYLKVLMDEIFGRSNYISTISVRTKSPSGFQSVNPGVFKTAEYIMIYSKNKAKWNYNQVYSQSDYDKNYKWYVSNKEESYEQWEIKDAMEYVAKENGCESAKDARKKFGEIVFDRMVGEFALEHADSIFRFTAIGNDAGKEIKELRDKSKENNGIVFKLKRENHYDVYIYNGSEMAFYSKKVRDIDGKMVPSMQITNIWNDIAYEGISSEGSVTLKKGKKPERLIKRIIEMCTNPGDIVLDAYLGSGTTAAVAHKLGRKYIGIEQLSSHMEIAIKRVVKVINGDKTGISKIINWKGGGSFIYLELGKNSQKYIDEINNSTTVDELNTLYNKLRVSDFISYRVDINKMEEQNKSFLSLSEKEKRQLLINIIDKNTLYINYCDMDDDSYNISDNIKQFNNSFYNKGMYLYGKE